VYTVTLQICNSVCLTTANVYFSDETPPHFIVAELCESGICSCYFLKKNFAPLGCIVLLTLVIMKYCL